MASEKFCLKWSNFQSNVSKSFSSLRNDSEFSDVTLISSDRKLVKVHKIVLSTCSAYFKDILTQSKIHNPLICLEGVSDADLNKVLDYIYHGEIQVYQDYLERFLNLARRFELDGLTVGNNVASEPDSRPKETTPPIDDSPGPLFVKDEQLDESQLPELVEGKIVENKRSKEKTEEFGPEDEDANSDDVEWHFWKTRRMSGQGPGVLITHSGKYKFYDDCSNYQYRVHSVKKLVRWTCSEKVKTKCNATAVMRRITIPGKDGEKDMVDFKLVRVSSEQDHSLYHGSNYYKINAEKIMAKLKEMATDDIFEKISVIEKRGLQENLWSKFPEDEAKLIRDSMPESIINTLSHTRYFLRDKHIKSFEVQHEPEEKPVEEIGKQEEITQASEDVEWYFLRTRKTSHGPGVLITHGDKYKFHENGLMGDKYRYYNGKKTFWWSCAEKKRTGCRATAAMKMKTIPGKDGEEDTILHKLVRVSPEETHTLYHGPMHHKIQAEKIMTRMKTEATENMFEKLGAIEKRVLEEDLWSKYSEDDAKLIRAIMPERIYNTLSQIRVSLRSKHLKSFEEGPEEDALFQKYM